MGADDALLRGLIEVAGRLVVMPEVWALALFFIGLSRLRVRPDRFAYGFMGVGLVMALAVR